MGMIHKLVKDNKTIFPATITDAVVHPRSGRSLTSIIDTYNVSVLFPTEGLDGGNTYNLALAIQVLGAHLSEDEKRGGVSVKFVQSSDNKYVQYRYVSDSIEVASFVNTNNWVTAVEDKSIDIIQTPTKTTPGGNSISSADGSIVTSTSGATRVKTYSIDPTKSYKASGRRPATIGLCMLAYYASDGLYIGYELESSGSAVSIVDYTLTIPSNAAFVKISGNTNSQDGVLKLSLSELSRLHQDISELQQEAIELENEITDLQDILSTTTTIIQTPTDTNDGKCIDSNGILQDTTSSGASVHEFSIDIEKEYYASGVSPSTSSGNLFCAYYGENGGFIGVDPGLEVHSSVVVDLKLTIPTNATTIKIFRRGDNPPKLVCKAKEYVDVLELQQDVSELQQDVSELQQDVTDIKNAFKIKTVETPTATHDGKALQSNGQLRNSTSSTLNATVHDFNIDPTKKYVATGWCPSIESDNVLAAFYDSNDAFISPPINPSPHSGVTDYSLTIPNNASIFRIFGRDTDYQPQLKLVTEEDIDLEELKEDVTELKEDVTELQNQEIPQIFNNQIQRKSLSETVKILCFGSSWFMDTWWYLNKIIQSAGINAELHCYYIGHSRFNEWIDLYKNDLTPFSGSEESRSASKNISINGADWTITKYRSNYTAQQFRDDWYNDLILEDWDIIAFQQGARQAPYWDLYWKDYWSELVKIVKTHCNPNTIIAFNSTWAPAVQDSAELSPWPATREGQMGWQEANWENTKRFMGLSGIYNVSPNGKTMYLLRNSELNTETDLADDGLHPNNGLPIYALGGTFFETYIAPMYGISFKTVEWLPTTSTQKASVSKQTWTPVSSSDSVLVKNIIKQALGDRFKF